MWPPSGDGEQGTGGEGSPRLVYSSVTCVSSLCWFIETRHCILHISNTTSFKHWRKTP